jgi:hypothetical protein
MEVNDLVGTRVWGLGKARVGTAEKQPMIGPAGPNLTSGELFL